MRISITPIIIEKCMHEKYLHLKSQGLLYLEAKEELRNRLARHPLFYHLELTIGVLLILIEEKKIRFHDTHEGNFCTDILFKLVDETSGFLGCLNQGSFYSSLHHTRALVELHATIQFCFATDKKNMFEKYYMYTKVRRHILFLDATHGSNSWNLSVSDREFLEKNYGMLDTNALAILGYKDLEQARAKMRKSSNWFISLEELLKHAGESHGATYERLCYFTHFSPLTDRSKQVVFGFPAWWEQTLNLTAYYFLECLIALRSSNYGLDETNKLLEHIHADLAVLALNQKVT